MSSKVQGVHNVMEEVVAGVIDDVASGDAAMGELLAEPQNRLDVLCFVLNRIPPAYIVSGRGLAHLQENEQNRRQLDADLVARVYEGVRRVRDVRRHPAAPSSEEEHAQYYFRFPAVAGRLLNGATLQPLSGVSVRLLCDGQPAPMANPRWANPYPISDRTPGAFVFWPRPEPADHSGQTRGVDFELVLDDQAHPFSHRFTLSAVSEVGLPDSINVSHTRQLGDLFWSPVDAEAAFQP